MNTSGDAAEQVVRISLEGMEKVLRVSGEGAKQIIAMVFAALRDKQQTMGKTNLINMIKSGKNVKIFSIQKEDLQKFVDETKRYGILYCALMDKKNKSDDGVIDIMVREEDAPKVNRIVERFNLSILDTASLRTEIQKKDEIAKDKNDNNEEKTEEKSDVNTKEEVIVYSNEEIVKELLGEEEVNLKNIVPSFSKMEKEPLSKHSLKNKEGLGEDDEKRFSVRKELNKIKENATLSRAKEEKRTKKVQKRNNKKQTKDKGR